MPAYRDEVLADAPAVYYRLGEATVAPAYDSSGNGRHAAYNAVANGYYGPFVNTTTSITADPDLSTYFNGSSSKITLPSTFSLPAAVTAEAWIRTSSVSANREIIGAASNAAASGFRLYLIAGAAVVAELVPPSPGAVVQINSSPLVVSTNTWRHVALTFNGTDEFRLYVDGAQVGATVNPALGAHVPYTGVRYIGSASNGTSNFFENYIDEVAIYPAALSAARILAHYNARYVPLALSPYGAAVVADAPRAWWRMETANGVGGVTGDQSGNGNHIYLNGGYNLTQAPATVGDRDFAVNFNGTSAYASASYRTTLNLGSGPGSLEVWARIPDTGIYTGLPTLIAFGASQAWTLFMDGGNRHLMAYSTGTGYIDANHTFQAGVWYHIVLTVDAAKLLRVYVNGVQTYAATHTAWTSSTSLVTNVGQGGASSNYWRGLIDEVAIYDTALPAARVLDHYTKGVGPYGAAVKADNPVGWWRFDQSEGSTDRSAGANGTACDLLGTEGTGYTLRNPGATSSTPSGTAVRFNGTSGYARVNHHADFSFTGDFTVEAWVNLAGYAGHCLVVNKVNGGGGATCNYELQVRPDGLIQFVQVVASGQEVRQSTRTVRLNTWEHIAFTKAGTVLTFYLNGQPAGTATVTALGIINSYPVYIGSRPDFYSYPNGLIDEVAIYPTALSAARMYAHFEASQDSKYKAAVLSDGALGWWRLNDPTGTTAVDASGYGRHGTYSGPLLAQPGVPGSDAGYAAAFDGVNDSVELSSVCAGMDFATPDAVTVEAWVKLAPANGNGNDFWFVGTNGGDADANIQYRYGTAGDTSYFYWDTGRKSDQWDLNQGLAEAGWNHVVFVGYVSAGTTYTSVYVNGTLRFTKNEGANAAFSNITGLRLGVSPAGVNAFFGWLQDVAVYNSALSAARIQAHYDLVMPRALTGSRYESEVLADAPRAYWRLNEAGPDATVYDLSGFGRHGGATAWPGGAGHSYGLASNDPRMGTSHGLSNPAAENATGPWIDCGFDQLAYGDPAAFTLEAWVYLTPQASGTPTSGTTILGCHNNANRGYAIYVASVGSGYWRLGLRLRDAQWPESAANLAVNTWHHVAATYDGTNYRLYVNGALSYTEARTQTPGGCGLDNHWMIAGRALGWQGPASFNGRIDEAAFYPTALSGTRIAAHYQAGAVHAGVATLTDDFNDNVVDTAKWTAAADPGTAATEVNQRIEFDCNDNGLGYAGLRSNARYRLTGSSVVVECVDPGALAVGATAELDLFTDPAVYHYGFGMVRNGTDLRAQTATGAAPVVRAAVTFVHATMRWWRIRESGGTVYWEYSPTGGPGSWTLLHSEAIPASVDVTDLQLDLWGGTYLPDIVVGVIKFDNLNLPPPTSPAALLVDGFSGAAPDATKWGAYADAGTAVAQTGGRLEVDLNDGGTGYAGLYSIDRWNLTDSVVALRCVDPGLGGTGRTASLDLELDASNVLKIIVDGPNVMAQTIIGGTNTSFGTTAFGESHRWWRIREAGGTVTFETSPTGRGSTWTALYSRANPFALTALTVKLFGGTYAVVATPGVVKLDSLNVAAPVNQGALRFNGTSASALAADHNDFDLLSAWTVEFWFKNTLNWSTAMTVTNKGSNLGVRFTAGGSVLIQAGSSGWGTSHATSLNVWHHWAATFDGAADMVRIYRDGVLIFSVGQAVDPTADANPFYVGRLWSSASEWLAGLLDEVRVWGVARSATEIVAYQYAQARGDETGLVAVWRGNEGSGTTTADSAAGTPHPLTLTNVTWETDDVPFLDDPKFQSTLPSSTTAAGTWTDQSGGTANLHAVLDEPATAISDADYARSVPGPQAEVLEVGLATAADPDSGSSHTVSVRALLDAAGGPATLTTELRQDGAALAPPVSWTDSPTTTAQTFAHALTTAQADAITDYADLRLRFTADQQATPGGPTPTFVAAGTFVQTAVNAATLTPGLPAGWAANDIHVLVTARKATDTAVTALSGWTQLAGISGNSQSGMRTEVWWRRAVGGDTAPVVTHGSGTTLREAQIFGVRNCPTTGSPFAQTSAPADALSRTLNGSSTTVTTAAVVPTEATYFSIFAFTSAAGSTTASQPSGWSTFTVARSGNNGICMGYCTQTFASGGTTGAPSTTISQAGVSDGLLLTFRGTQPVPATSRARVTWAQLEVPPPAELARRVTAGAALQVFNLTRTTPATAAVRVTRTRTAAATAAVRQQDLTRTVGSTAAVAPPSPYATAVLADAPIGYWRLGEPSGTTALDSSGNSRLGTYTGGVTLAQSGALADTTTAALFDGTNDWVRVLTNAGLAVTGPFSVEAWVKTTLARSVGSPKTVYDAYSPGFSGYTLSLWNGRVYAELARVGSSLALNAPSVINDGAWHHVVFTYDGANVGRVYVDGALDYEDSGTGVYNNAAWSGDRAIGSTLQGGGLFFPGGIDEVAVYGAVLPAARVAAHYAAAVLARTAPATAALQTSPARPVPATAPLAVAGITRTVAASAAVAPPSRYAPVVLADAPLGYWRLGEAAIPPATTVATDSSGNGRHALYTPGVPVVGQGGAVMDGDTAVLFDGVTQHVNMGNVALSGASFSIEFFEKRASAPGTETDYLVGHGFNIVAARQGLHIGFRSPTAFVFGLYGDDLELTIAADTGVWHHWVFTFNAATFQQTAYLDGAQIGQRTAGGTYVGVTSPLRFGARWDGASPYHGSMDEFALYMGVLSPARVTAHYAARLTGTYPSAVLADAPWAYYRLGDPPPATAADVTGSYPGVLYGGPAMAQPGALAGDPNTSADFATAGQLRVPHNAAFNRAEFTVELWVYLHSYGTVASWRVLAQKTGPGATRAFGIWLKHSTNSFLHTSYGDGTNYWGIDSSVAALPIGRWSHVAITRSAATGVLSLYINGVLDGSMTQAIAPAATTRDIEVGWGEEGFERFPGRVDELAYYPTALPPARIAAHYAAGAPYAAAVRADAPLGYWRLGEATGTTAFDSSGNNNHGTHNAAGITLGQPGAVRDADAAASFPGPSTAYINVTPTSATVGVSDRFTMEAWIRSPGSWGNGHEFLGWAGSSANYLTVINGEPMFSAILGGSQRLLYMGSYLPANFWAHLVAVWDGAFMRLYVNGLQVASSAQPGPIATGTYVRIGEYDGTLGLSGLLDEFAVYNTALSPARVKAHYDAAETGEVRTVRAGAVLQTTPTRTAGAAAALLTTPTRTAAATAALRTSPARTVASAAAVLTTRARTVAAAGALQTTRTRTAGASAVVAVTFSRTVGATTAVRTTLTRTASASAALRTETTRTVPATAAVEDFRVVAAAAALAGSVTRQAAATAALRATLERAAGATAAVRTTLERAGLAAAALRTTPTRTAGATAALQTVRTRTAGATAALRTTLTRSAGATAVLRTTLTRTAGAAAALRTTLTRSAGTTAATLTTRTRTAGVTAALLTARTRTVAATAAVVTTGTRTAAVAAAVRVPVTRTVAALAALRSTPTRVVGLSAVVAAKSYYATAVLLDNPVGYWRLGESGGTTALDSSANFRHGTYTGGVTLGQEGPLADGTTAALFDGSSGQATVPHDPAFDLTGDLTIEAWVSPTDRATYYMIVTKTVNGAADNTFEFRLEMTTGLPTFVQSPGGSYQIMPAAAAPPVNVWSHLAVVKSGATVTHYLNGSPNGSNSITGAIPTNTIPVRIGTRGGGYLFSGLLDEIAVYGTALSPTRIDAHYVASTIGLSRTVALGAALRTTRTRTVPSAGAALWTTRTRTVGAGAILRTTPTRAVAAGAALRTSPSRTVAASAAIRAHRIVAATAALLAQRPVPASAAVRTTGARAVPALAALRTIPTRTVGATAALQPQRVVRASAALLILRTVPATAAVRSLGSRTIGASAATGVARSRSAAAAAALRTAPARLVPAGAAVGSTLSRQVTAGAAVSVARVRAVGATAAVLVLPPRVVPAAAALRAAGARVVYATAAIERPTNGVVLEPTARRGAVLSPMAGYQEPDEEEVDMTVYGADPAIPPVAAQTNVLALQVTLPDDSRPTNSVVTARVLNGQESETMPATRAYHSKGGLYRLQTPVSAFPAPGQYVVHWTATTPWSPEPIVALVRHVIEVVAEPVVGPAP